MKLVWKLDGGYWCAPGVNRRQYVIAITNEGLFEVAVSNNSTMKFPTIEGAKALCQRQEDEANAKPVADQGSCTSYGTAEAILRKMVGEVFGEEIGEDVEVVFQKVSMDDLGCDVYSDHLLDEDGKPDGGMSCGYGFAISWQRGPTRAEEGSSRNGAFVTEVLSAVFSRLKHYQDTKFKCEQNERAMFHIHKALESLNQRREERKSRGVEGTHAV